MYSRGIRGAITLKKNSKDEIKSATVELLSEMLEKNNVKTEDISFAIFTLTEDIDADFPAKYARECLSFQNVPMVLCMSVMHYFPVSGACPSQRHPFYFQRRKLHYVFGRCWFLDGCHHRGSSDPW